MTTNLDMFRSTSSYITAARLTGLITELAVQLVTNKFKNNTNYYSAWL